MAQRPTARVPRAYYVGLTLPDVLHILAFVFIFLTLAESTLAYIGLSAAAVAWH